MICSVLLYHPISTEQQVAIVGVSAAAFCAVSSQGVWGGGSPVKLEEVEEEDAPSTCAPISNKKEGINFSVALGVCTLPGTRDVGGVGYMVGGAADWLGLPVYVAYL